MEAALFQTLISALAALGISAAIIVWLFRQF